VNPTSIACSIVPEAKGGPFVLWDPLPVACRKARELGYDAIELFAPSAEGLDDLEKTLKDHGLKLAAMGTGAGAVLRKLTLTSPDAEVRRAGREFINSVIAMQGRVADRSVAIDLLRPALEEFGERARKAGTTFLLEPLNRYEGNVVNTIGDATEIIRSLSTRHVTILADLFHMNIEEQDVCGAIRGGASLITHVQLADSNRRPPGHGHTDFRAVAASLASIGYTGYLSAEALPWPDPDAAARLAIEGIRRFFAC
jgi:sugar phosphate isomerase/epimerase